MNFDKYLLHDMYHVTYNLEIIQGYATKEKILHHVRVSGERKNKHYKDEEILKCLNHMETIRMFKQISKDKYVVNG